MASRENQKLMIVSVTSLPHDVMVDNIFPRLPAKSLARFKCVCKLWFKAISDPSFAKSHLTFQTPGRINISQGSILSYTNSTHTDSSYKLNLSDILGETRLLPIKSCNGLLLVRNQKGFWSMAMHYIINPVTRRHVSIPPPVEAVNGPSTKVSSASMNYFMHYDSVSHEYKVLGWKSYLTHSRDPVYALVLNDRNRETEISWMALRQPQDLIMMWYQPVLFKGRCHWVVIERKRNGKWAILALNIESREFRVMGVPDTAEMIPSEGWNYKLAMVDSSLYLIQHHCPGENYCYILWILEDYGQQVWCEVGQYRVELCQQCKESGWHSAMSASTGHFDVKGILKRGALYGVVHTNSLAWLDTRL